MTRIHSGSFSLDAVLQNNLTRALDLLTSSTTRLSTLKRISQGSDDPAALIAAGDLQNELTALEAADGNAARADSALAVADSALGQVNDLLGTIQDGVLAAASGTASEGELAAYQQQVDSALESINRIGASTEFNGRHLLDGSGDGVLTFALSADPSQTASVDLPTVHTSQLGGIPGELAALASGGPASLASGNLTEALDIVEAARGSVQAARAQVGAFQHFTIESSRNVGASAQENVSAALSQIQDADLATETSRYLRSQILLGATLGALRLNNSHRAMVIDLFDDLYGTQSRGG